MDVTLKTTEEVERFFRETGNVLLGSAPKGDADVFPTQNVLCCEPQRFPILHRTHPSQ